MKFKTQSAIWALVAGLGCSTALGQWVQQSFPLETGWNTVFLEVDPMPRDSDAVFGGLPVDSVWTPADAPIVSLPVDAAADEVDAATWWHWLPPGNRASFGNSLKIIRGGRAYLVHATAPATLTVTGRPNHSRTTWEQGFSFHGFHVDPASPPRVREYLDGAPSFEDQPIYLLASNGAPVLVADDVQGICVGGTSPGSGCFDDGDCGEGGTCDGAVTHMVDPGAGYWVRSPDKISYDGPVSIDSVALRGMDFGRNISSQTLTVRNLGDAPRTAALTVMDPGAAPAVSGIPSQAGGVPLQWRDYGGGAEASGVYQWMDMTTGMAVDFPLGAGGSASAGKTVTLQVNRRSLAGAVVGNVCVGGMNDGQPCGVTGDCGEDGFCGEVGSQYQSVLVVSDGRGFRRLIPIEAQVRSGLDPLAEGGGMTMAGLWLGQVTLDAVSWVTGPLSGDTGGAICNGGDLDGSVCSEDADCCAPCTATCSDGACSGGDLSGETCLVDADCCTTCSGQCIGSEPRPTPATFSFPFLIHLSDSGEYKLLTEVTLLWQEGEPGDIATGVPGTPGFFVLATPECGALCDSLTPGEVVDGRPFARRLSTVAFGFEGDQPMTGSFDSSLAISVVDDADGLLNPYRHRMHPDHASGFDVVRDITLTFATDPPPGLVTTGWGYTLLAGTYEEQVSGLHRSPIRTSGRFQMRRISQVGTLNGQ